MSNSQLTINNTKNLSNNKFLSAIPILTPYLNIKQYLSTENTGNPAYDLLDHQWGIDGIIQHTNGTISACATRVTNGDWNNFSFRTDKFNNRPVEFDRLKDGYRNHNLKIDYTIQMYDEKIAFMRTYDLMRFVSDYEFLLDYNTTNDAAFCYIQWKCIVNNKNYKEKITIINKE
jgi:hypothetical protein